MNIVLWTAYSTKCDFGNRTIQPPNHKADRKANENNESKIRDLDSVKPANLHIINKQ